MSTTDTDIETGLTPLEKARLARQAMRDAGISVERLDPIEKARQNPTSLRLAINGKCWDCVGAGVDANPRRAIRECHITGCTLWPVRPYQGKAVEGDEDEMEPVAV